MTTDLEVRFAASGTAVANFTIASSPRVFDKNLGEWRDGETLFCSARYGNRVRRISPTALLKVPG
jgi:single-stranded DNA-binding protein